MTAEIDFPSLNSSRPLLEALHGEGYTILRRFLPSDLMQEIGAESDRIYEQGLQHHATYRDRNLLFEILDDPQAGRRVVLQVHWMAWISPLFERLRRDARYLKVLEPFLGQDIKQIAHQLHWKPPGAKYTFYRYHQDARFRNQAATRNFLDGNVTTGLAIDRQTAANGALRVIPRSHRRGYLGLSEDGTIMTGSTPDDELRKVGLDPASAVTCEMEPGDLLLWTLYTVHGSAANLSEHDRRFLINSYVRAGDSDRGEWAFRGGVSTPLGEEPQICKYEQLRERPGPFYIEPSWTEEAQASQSPPRA
ncbi:MAG: phytanoyl-CoA dioxygenase family protein [Gammaproteobacteria bacterium]|nr:phytanoyl-CoA dioxygenase family protein [Gammaproteobacteria bacterium]MBV9620677.1 phytanoyl-CoA dioxygenase family protein [Gammaproteobacteria bacterium]